MRFRGFASASLLLLLVGGATADETVSRTLQARVAAAVYRDLGLDEARPGVELKVSALTAEFRLPRHAELHVSAVKRVGKSDSFVARVECQSKLDCLPFQVWLVSPPGVSLSASGRQAPPAIVGMASEGAAGLSGGPHVAPLVRAGERVRVGEEISGMHLSAPAICLQPGSLGQTIRVRNTASGRVLRARVLAAGAVVVEER